MDGGELDEEGFELEPVEEFEEKSRLDNREPGGELRTR